VNQDITERKQTEEKIQASLQEKEVLLREVHHRVKNNMGVISGLLNLKASSSENPEVIRIMQESNRQIQSMALIHEKLYGEKDWTSIDLGSYTADMVRNLSEFYAGGLSDIDTKIEAKGIRLSIDKAVPIGLILNELVSNAYKHAFPKGRPGILEIVIRKPENGKVELIVRDNGRGLPNAFDPEKTKSVGLYLVNGLVKNQLHGEMSVGSGEGTEFRIRFPL
jgi:two-component sensor histidine kinase